MQQPINEFETPADLMQAAAIGHAMAGEWGDAVSANLKLIAHDPSDLEAHNRLGKAYTSLGRSKAAIRAYRAALAISPGNPIAERNLARLVAMGSDGEIADGVGAAVEMARVTGSVDGSVILTRLERTAGQDVLEGVPTGDKLTLEASPAGVRVSTTSGKYLGVVNGKLNVRIAKLIVRGNRYEAFANGGGESSFAIQIVESFRHPDLASVISFPSHYVEREEPNLELDKYDMSDGALAHEGVEGSSLVDLSDDEIVQHPDSAGRSALSGEMEAPAI
jgi:tetratricopeptide (TPR) repeat protein